MSSLSILSQLRLAGLLVLDYNQTDFPTNPQLGTIAMKNYGLYAYIQLGGVSGWYPLVDAPKEYIFQQTAPLTTWTVTHNMGSVDYFYQIQDSNGQLMTASDVKTIDANTVEFDFTEAVQGKVLLLFDGVGKVPVVSVAGKIGDVTLDTNDIGGLSTALAGKVDTTEVGAANGVAPLDASGKVPSANLPATDFPVTSINGKTGDVVLGKADVGLDKVDDTADLDKPISTATQTALNAKEPTVASGTTGQYYRGDKTWVTLDKIAVGLDQVDNTSDANKPISTATQTALNTKLDSNTVGAANGVTPLGSDSKVPAAYLPSYVDDVLEFSTLSAFPNPGAAGKIYVADDTEKIYRWSGSTYIEISPSPGSTDAVPEGSVNLYYTSARAAAAAPVQSVAGKTGAVTLSMGDVGITGKNSQWTNDSGYITASASITGNAATATKIQSVDSRAVASQPSDFHSGVTFDFKEHAAIALGDGSTANFAGVLSLAPWADFSGGGNHQMAFDVGGKMYYRYGDANGWGVWNQLWTAASLSKLSQLSNDSGFITASGAPVQSVAGKTGTVTLSASDISGLATVATSGKYADLSGQPTIPTNNTQLSNGAGYITASGAPVQSVAGKTGTVTLTKGDVGLGNVDNTADASKSVANATTWGNSNKTVSTGAPSGGNDGDFWFEYS